MCKIVEDIVQKETYEASVRSFIEGLIAAGISEFTTLVSKVVERFGISQADAENAVQKHHG